MEIKQRLYKRRLDVKMAWSKSQKKQLQDNYKECTDTSYGRAVALTKINTKKLKQNTEKKITINKKCKCSSETHQRITHKDYPENPKNKKSKEDSTRNTPQFTCGNGSSEVHEKNSESVPSET
jgi:sulfate adenylyltransferase subunit 1 (EFTu-like GTPase family)